MSLCDSNGELGECGGIISSVNYYDGNRIEPRSEMLIEIGEPLGVGARFEDEHVRFCRGDGDLSVNEWVREKREVNIFGSGYIKV